MKEIKTNDYSLFISNEIYTSIIELNALLPTNSLDINSSTKSFAIVFSSNKYDIDYVKSNNLPAICILNSTSYPDFYFKYVIADVSEINYYLIDFVYNRYNNSISRISHFDDISIYEMKATDFDSIYNMYNKLAPSNTSFLANNYMLGVYESEKNNFIEYCKTNYVYNIFGLYIIKDSRMQTIGQCGFYRLNNKVYISYFVIPAFRNKGIASKAINSIINYLASLSAIHDIEYIYALASHSNDASINLLKKYQFKLCNFESNKKEGEYYRPLKL